MRSNMRTTISIDDEILVAAKAIAHQQRRTVGDVISDLARRSLRPTSAGRMRNGVPLLPVRDAEALVTMDIVNALRDELP